MREMALILLLMIHTFLELVILLLNNGKVYITVDVFQS